MIISYDFDGTLHSSVHPGTIHPIQFDDHDEWIPNEDMFKRMREDAKIAKIVIVTARHSYLAAPIWKFVAKYNLPVSAIYCTNDRPKLNVLKSIGAAKHYDDSIAVGNELSGTDIEFVLVRNGEPIDERVNEAHPFMKNVLKFLKSFSDFKN